ncbi:MAG: hypothetical protein P1P76_06435 [Anaerolineales bacterium]|nr:hypothetical protein [Anaerolineales bacterium]
MVEITERADLHAQRPALRGQAPTERGNLEAIGEDHPRGISSL